MLVFFFVDCWIVLKFGGILVLCCYCWDMIGKLVKKCVEEIGLCVLVVVLVLFGVINELIVIVDGVLDSGDCVVVFVECYEGFLVEFGLGCEVLVEWLVVLQGLFDDVWVVICLLDWQVEVLGQGELLFFMLGVVYLCVLGLDMGWMDVCQWLDVMLLQLNQSDWLQWLLVNCQWCVDVEWMQCFCVQLICLLIIQGFILWYVDGGIVIFGCGGLDILVVYFGVLFGVSWVEIWIDVLGMFSVNLKDVLDVCLLICLDYYEVQEIVIIGVKVFYLCLIKLCCDVGVLMVIFDIECLELLGISIDGSVVLVLGVKVISCCNGIVLVLMEGIGMWQQVGFLVDVFNLFKKYGLLVDLIGLVEINVMVLLDLFENLVNIDVLVVLLVDLLQICKVKVIVLCVVIILVGCGMWLLLYKLLDVWVIFGCECVYMILQLFNDLNLIFVIDEVDVDGLLLILYVELIDSGVMLVEEIEVFGLCWCEIVGIVCLCGMLWWCGQCVYLLQLVDVGMLCYVYYLLMVCVCVCVLVVIKLIDQCYYVIKVNSYLVILQLLEVEGFGLECVLYGELRYVFQYLLELLFKCVLFIFSFCLCSEYEVVFVLGVIVIVDNVEVLQCWLDLFCNCELWLCVDLGWGEGYYVKVCIGGKEFKFGLLIVCVDEFLCVVIELGSCVVGLYVYLGSGVEIVQYWCLMCDELVGFVCCIGSVQIIDIGGGLLILYSDEDEFFDLDVWVEGLVEVKVLYLVFCLVIELGCYLVVELGVLLIYVIQVVEKDGVCCVGLDVGMNVLMCLVLYDVWYDIENFSCQGGYVEVVFDVVGLICEFSDVFGKCCKLLVLIVLDDVMLIVDVGVYGYVMVNIYNQWMLLCEDVIE